MRGYLYGIKLGGISINNKRPARGRPLIRRYGLELCVLRRTWEWYHIADVGHTRNEEQQTLEAQAEARVH